MNSSTLSNSPWFVGLVQAALTEYALAHPDDPLARTLIRDPGFMLPMFVSVAADNATISTDVWKTLGQGIEQQQNDVRWALSDKWAALSGALPNLGV